MVWYVTVGLVIATLTFATLAIQHELDDRTSGWIVVAFVATVMLWPAVVVGVAVTAART